MQRMMIFILMGIICYSTFTSLIPTWPEPDKYRMLLDTVYGTVAAGNFTYWIFGQKGPLIIELVSVSGDADLFVGDTPRPGFEADKNNFSSETCGIDIVIVPEDFPRPIGIGVYGHWSHVWSDFSMKVYADLSREGAKQGAWDGAPTGSASVTGEVMTAQGEQGNGAKESEAKRHAAAARKEDDKPRVLKLFRVLDTVFETVLDLVLL